VGGELGLKAKVLQVLLDVQGGQGLGHQTSLQSDEKRKKHIQAMRQ
jgi:hypothetical protein